MENEIVLSSLGHTWILDLDGTVVKHNGYKSYGTDSFLEGAEEFLHSIPENDMIIFITSRTEEYKELTEKFLLNNNIRYNYIIYNAPYGERILINDKKKSGLITAIALNYERDSFVKKYIKIDDNL